MTTSSSSTDAAPRAWYALWTASHCERAVHEQLAVRGFEVFLPEQRVWSTRRGVRRLVPTPLFPGYLFLRDVMSKERYIAVRQARGLVAGLTRGSGRAELARAALECVAYQTADLIDAMAADGAPCQALKVDGGMVANDWLMQFLADIQNAAVDRPAILETTAFGAAFLAGVKAGVYGSLDDVARLRRTQRRFSPEMAPGDRAALRSGWRKALERALL